MENNKGICMKYLAIATILTLATLMACETEDPVEETPIIVDEESTIVVKTSAEEQADENLNSLDRIVQNLTSGRSCYVGEMIHLKATVAERSLIRFAANKPWIIDGLAAETNNNNLWIYISMFPVNDFLQCPANYYKDGETYVFPILITTIAAEKDVGWRKGDPISFEVYSEIVVTEELKKELRKVDCGAEEG